MDNRKLVIIDYIFGKYYKWFKKFKSKLIFFSFKWFFVIFISSNKYY